MKNTQLSWLMALTIALAAFAIGCEVSYDTESNQNEEIVADTLAMDADQGPGTYVVQVEGMT